MRGGPPRLVRHGKDAFHRVPISCLNLNPPGAVPPRAGPNCEISNLKSEIMYPRRSTIGYWLFPARYVLFVISACPPKACRRRGERRHLEQTDSNDKPSFKPGPSVDTHLLASRRHLRSLPPIRPPPRSEGC